MSGSRIIVALDYASPAEALGLVGRLEPASCRLKVGKELFVRGGPALIERLVHDGFEVFLDLKFHDIPNTVAKACAAAAELGVWMLNVHALGGRKMMLAARDAITASRTPPILIAVTVLTSMDEQALAETGVAGTVEQSVLRLATLAQQSGMDGVVCSPLEAPALRQSLGAGFCLVTPGIRLPGGETGDQKRYATPAQALRNGADYLVIGRPITAAQDPMQALHDISSSITARS
ncbi:MAG: orotidine-5'-phosphate decarboxylase [Gammaproteobacteria bacterium]|nr:orotidine-5'-phosphate decarboxylase [Gammaproteobacteria bacterium]